MLLGYFGGMTRTGVDSRTAEHSADRRPVWRSLRLGVSGLCPHCGSGALFSSYLEVVKGCGHCGEEFYHHRADDAPPYFTIFLLGHIVLPLALIVEFIWHPTLLVHLSLWIPLAILMALMILPRVKGAIVALQWALRMHGFEYAALAGPRRPEVDQIEVA
jgi:uncharacterized protein (DUF983 family)